jgi:hypothetical protein
MGPMYFLCNGGALYAPYSFLSISNMLCVGGGIRVVTLAVVYDPVLRVIKYGPWINLSAQIKHLTHGAVYIMAPTCHLSTPN